MAELEPKTSAEVTERLVEQLTRTNERLERLEATLREVSLLSGLQREPLHRETTSAAPDTTGEARDLQAGITGSATDNRDQEAEAHFRRGVVLCQSRKFDEAVTAWQEVLRLQPENAYALANIGIVYTEQARWSEAHEMFTRVLRIQPENAEAYYGLGMANAQLGDYAAAITAWENAIRLQPDNADARYNLALVRQRLAPGQPSSRASGPTDAAVSPESQKSADFRASMPPPTVTETREGGVLYAPQKVVAARSGSSSTAPAESNTPRRRATDRVEEAPPIMKGRPSMTSQTGLLRIGGIAIAAAALAGFLLYSRYHPSASLNGAAAGTTRDSAAISPPAANIPAAAKPAGETLPLLASKPAASTPTVETVAAPPNSVASDSFPQHGSGPARPGKMQIRLASGLSGPFRYWFVSKSNSAASLRPLPTSARNGIITLPIPAAYNQPDSQLRIMNVGQGKVARFYVMDSSQPTVAVWPNVGPNLLQNADFTQGAKAWQMETTAPGRGAMRVLDGLATPPGVPGRAVHFDVTAISTQGWNVQCYQGAMDMQEGKPYLLSFWAKSDRNRPLHIDVILDRPDWHQVGIVTTVNLTPDWHKYVLPFKASRTQPGHTRISFILGEAIGPVELAGITLRRSQGVDTSGPVQPNWAVTISANDFN